MCGWLLVSSLDYNSEDRSRGCCWHRDDSTYALLHEKPELALIFNLDELLSTGARVADVELHFDKDLLESWRQGTI